MRRIAILAAIAWGLAALEGCGNSETPPTDAQAQGQPKAPPVPPEVVTREFLEAVRTGDDAKADSLLTDLAREKTKQVDLVLKPTPSQTAKYEVGEVVPMEGQVVYVQSFWTDIDEMGKPRTDPFVWALRLDTNGWRIGGVAVKPFENEPELLLNFEDPEDMLHKQAMLEAEMLRRMNGGALPSGTAAPLAGGSNGATAPGAALQGGQSVAAQPDLATPATVPPGALTPGTAPGVLPPGTSASGGTVQPAGLDSMTVPTALAPGALPPGAANTQPLPGSIVPAGGFSTPGGPGTVQPTSTQSQSTPGFLPPGAQAQQPVAPGNFPR